MHAHLPRFVLYYYALTYSVNSALVAPLNIRFS